MVVGGWRTTGARSVIQDHMNLMRSSGESIPTNSSRARPARAAETGGISMRRSAAAALLAVGGGAVWKVF